MERFRHSDITFPHILLFLGLAILFIHFLIYISFGIALIPFPFDYDQAEGFELNNAILMARGDCPYCSNDSFPFYGSGYPPFFHILLIPFVWIFGPAFWYGRLLIFLSTFITTGAIAWAVFREDKHKSIALLAGLAFLASNYIYHIGPLLRQHLLMVMFETLAVVFVARSFSSENRPKHRYLLASFLFLLFAGYTKQLAFSTCIAVFIWVFLRNPRTALLYGMGLIGIAGIIFAGWLLITDNWWWTNIITANQNPYIPEQFTSLFKQFLRLHWTLLIPAVLMVGYELYFDRLSVYSIWFLASLGNTLSAGKWGAGDSYFATVLVSMCILTGIFLSRSWSKSWNFESNYLTQRLYSLYPQRFLLSQIATSLLLLLLVVYGLTVLKFPTSGAIFGNLAETFDISPQPGHRYPFYDSAQWTVGYAVTGHFPSEEDYQNGERIVDRVKNANGLVMSEDAGFSIQAGREVITNAVQLNNLWQNNLYDETELLELIESHSFGLVILRAKFFPPPILIAIEQNYVLDEKIPMNGFEYELWIPQNT